MNAVAVRVTQPDSGNGGNGRSPEIAVCVRRGAPNIPEAVEYVASVIQGCSLLYPHVRLTVDLGHLDAGGADLAGAIERHRSRVEAQGGSLRVHMPAAMPSF